MTDERPSKLEDATKKCKQMSAKLPIIKSESENNFILGLMSAQKSFVWLGMTRKQDKMVWFDNTLAGPSNIARYSAWKKGEPSNKPGEKCAFLDFHARTWNDNKCVHRPSESPFVLCQK